MDYKELKTKSLAELQKLLADLRESGREMRFKVASGQLKKVRDIRVNKKNISRIMFLLSQLTKADKK